jgi:hypothetical protein
MFRFHFAININNRLHRTERATGYALFIFGLRKNELTPFIHTIYSFYIGKVTVSLSPPLPFIRILSRKQGIYEQRLPGEDQRFVKNPWSPFRFLPDRRLTKMQ